MLCILQVYAEKYAEDEEAFFKDYAESHAKLSNLGAKFDPPEVCYTPCYHCCSYLNYILFVTQAILEKSLSATIHLTYTFILACGDVILLFLITCGSKFNNPLIT